MIENLSFKELRKKPSSVYIHVPFCIKKCRYCDFFSVIDLSLLPDYISCLKREVALRSDPQKEIDTIYFGGGTPSVLSCPDIKKIIHTVHRSFCVLPDTEVTVEINPGTLKPGYLDDLLSAGVNRISIGVQSFNEDKLNFLGRIHTAQEAVDTIDSARKAGFDNISIDLIYGLPFESKPVWRADLEKAVQMTPEHLSCYMLTIEPGTPLKIRQDKGRFIPMDADTRFYFFENTVTFLESCGYEHYEISNFAKGKTNRSRHNSKYWDYIPYMGFGPAAHSFTGTHRFWNHRDMELYSRDLGANKSPVAEKEHLSLEQKMLEMIMLCLRTGQGIDLAVFKARFEISFEQQFKTIILSTQQAGLADFDEKRFVLTLQGKIHLDSIIEAFAQKIPTHG